MGATTADYAVLAAGLTLATAVATTNQGTTGLGNDIADWLAGLWDNILKSEANDPEKEGDGETSSDGSGKGDIKSGDGIDLTDTETWPAPPGTDPETNQTEGHPRNKNQARGEKVIRDEDGNIWKPHTPDKYHPEGHWDVKGPKTGGSWQNVDVDGNVIP